MEDFPGVEEKHFLFDYIPFMENISDAIKTPDMLGDSEEEFVFSFNFSVDMISQVCSIGCYPMAETSMHPHAFLIKSHFQRAILKLKTFKPSRKIIQ